MIQKAKRIIRDGNRIVVLSGEGLSTENGLLGLRAEKLEYDIEAEYGYSPEEIASMAFYNRRTEMFYNYYKKYVIDLEKMKPQKAHYAIAELEKQGKLSHVITNSIYGLYQMAGVKQIMELHGSIHRNICPRCNRTYPVEYIANAAGVPYCEHCKIPIQPTFYMFGERLDNGLVSECTEIVSKADIAILLGLSWNSPLVDYVKNYFNGNHVIIIEGKQDFNKNLDTSVVLEGSCNEILPQIING